MREDRTNYYVIHVLPSVCNMYTESNIGLPTQYFTR